MATRTKMTVKVKGNGDKNEPFKNPKPQPKPAIKKVGKSTVNKANTNKALGNASDNVGKPHPVTGKPMTKAQAMQVERQKEYRKNS